MRNTRFISIALIILLLSKLLSGAVVWGARYPAPSPDGKKITLSYYGDIWTVSTDGGRADRLTVSDGFESKSSWSPDGKWIAFMTDRWGNDEICIMPPDGSAPPKRLTYYSLSDVLFGWTPDSKYVLYGTNEHTLTRVLYRVSINCGLPQMVTNFRADEVCFLPEGNGFYYTRGGAEWWRRRYKGGANQDIWLKVLPDGGSKKIVNSQGEDGYPMYSLLDKKLYFLSNRAGDGVKNLWRADPDGATPVQITFEEEDIHYPEMSADGGLISYECLGNIYTYNVGTGEKKKLSITVSEDYQENSSRFEEFSRNATEFTLSPDEKEIAFVIHGDIFVMEIEEDGAGKIVRVTNTPYIERYVSWHPKKELLIYSSMADGDMDVFTAEPRTEKRFYDDLLFDQKKILETKETEIKAKFSPDGEMIAYFKNGEELYVMDKDGSNSNKLCLGRDVLWIDWSPDSKWITFSRTTLGWREDIFVVPADGSEGPINISNHPNDDYKPMWSSDGHRIAFASRDAIGNLWMKYVFLLKEDEARDKAYWEKEKSDTTQKISAVKIDFDNIEDRIHSVTRVLGFYYQVAQSPDGKQFAIHSNNEDEEDIWTVDWLGKELKRVTKGSVEPRMFTVSRDHEKIYYLSGSGKIFRADIASASSDPLSFNVAISIDRKQERAETFKEAWFALQDGFYDSDFHGIDWQKMYHKYKDWALCVKTTRDFHGVVSRMIGELNASHLGIWSGGDGGEETGALGIVYDSDYKGAGVLIKEIIPESPASEDKVGLKVGDIITHINDERIEEGENYNVLLTNTVGKEIMLTISSNGTTRNVKIKPIKPWSLLELVDKNWVKANREYVREKASNQLGYLYIASMDESNLNEFEKDLYKELNKKGLIIDIRYNGGGTIHDELLNILRRTAYMYEVERGGQKEYSSLFRWDKPVVVLINEYCYSDAEIFSAGFKQLGLGKLIGVPTFGAVIGTNDIELLDGSTFRVPSTGWFRLDGQNLENIPVEPDIYIENMPEEDGFSSDQQLRKAIEVLLGEIKK